MAALEEDSLFTCSICLEKFTNPKYLPCLHTFCELCITSFIESAILDCEVQKKRVCFLCPECRSENYPPSRSITAEEWAEKLPKNYQLQSIADTLAGKQVFCESCRNNNEEKIATLRCKQCQNNLCEKCCTFIHQRVKEFVLHTIIDLRKSDFHKDLLGGQGLCADHSDKEITVYCLNHGTLCCTFCLTGKHSDCKDLISLDKIEEEEVKLSTQMFYQETQKMRNISKTAVNDIRKNVKSLHLKRDEILLTTAKKIQRSKEILDALYLQLENSLNTAHENTISKLTVSLETLDLFDETLSEATRFASAVLHNGSKKQMFVVLTKLQELISRQFKNMAEQRNELKLAQLKWESVDAIEKLANLTKLGDFEYAFQRNNWSAEIGRHLKNITKDANPKELVCGELKMKELIPGRILHGLTTGFTESQFDLDSRHRLLVVAFSIGSGSSPWWFSLTTDCLSVHQRKWPRNNFLRAPSLLLNPDKTVRAFGYEAQQQYSDLCKEDKHQSYFFIKNITGIAESEQCLNEHTKVTDTSGNKWKVTELLRLAYHFMVNDISKMFKQQRSPIDISDARIMMVLPSRWNDKTQKFIKEAVQKAGMPVHSIILEAEAAFYYYQYLTKERKSEEKKISFEKKYLIAEFGEETLTLTIHVQHPDNKEYNLTLDELVSDEILKIGFVQGGLQSFICEFESCITYLIGDEAMQILKTRDFSSYTDLVENVIRILLKDSEETDIHLRFPFASIVGYSTVSSFRKTIDMSAHVGKMKVFGNVIIWNKEDFYELFVKSVKRIIRSFMNVPSRDMVEIETIIMSGTLAECPLVQNAVKKSFSTKRIVVLTDDQVKIGAVYIGHMSS
uniref:Uncharacterized protein LOC111114729 isoform X2 n=1 Tax=Crassostrea virginica TaxID=6565 RepID=A0A8B8BZS1_CRAVI|nr:uncharacterized protein LOC111114729 isoform X2 [Crassostrea virginica]